MKATVLFLLGVLTPVWAAGPFEFRETGTGSVELIENGKPVYVYNYGMQLKEGVPESMRRCCYLSPVYTPGGVVVTDDFPKDHLHHRGIFWSWPVVKVGGNTYDAWAVKSAGDRFVRWLVRDANAGGKARLKVENGWFAGGKKIIRETVEILTRKANQGRRELDIALTFEALDEPVAIAGQQDGKGYGGFSVRFASRENTVLRTGSGIEAKDEISLGKAISTANRSRNASVILGGSACKSTNESVSGPLMSNSWFDSHSMDGALLDDAPGRARRCNTCASSASTIKSVLPDFCDALFLWLIARRSPAGDQAKEYHSW